MKSRAAHLARIRLTRRRVLATGRQHKAALDDFARAVEEGRAGGVSVPQAAAEVGLHVNTVRQALREARRRREFRKQEEAS